MTSFVRNVSWQKCALANMLIQSTAAYRLLRRKGISRIGPKDPTEKRSAASVSSKDSQVSKKSKTLHATARRMADRRSFLHNMRLDQTFCHLPAPAEAESGQKPVCAMCQWATGNQYRAQVLLIVFPVALDEGWDGGGAGPYLGQLNIIKYY